MSLYTRDLLSRKPSTTEWEVLFNDAQKQGIIGFLKEGLERLPEEQKLPQPILLQWIGLALQIEATNSLMFSRCVELQQWFKGEGLKSCILKGQGNAIMYPNPYSRTSGDIDIWVDIDL